MDELEKKIIEKHGTSMISTEDCGKILDQAAKSGLIERKDIRPVGPLDSSQLIEHISSLRRQFLFSEGFNMEEEVYESLQSSYENKENAQIFDKVIKAYFEYEKIKTVPKKKNYFLYTSLIVLIIFVALISYTPAPY